MPRSRKTGPVKPDSRDRGRPRKGDAPTVPWHEVDRLLVFGEKVKDQKTGKSVLRHPSYSELAKRYGVSKSRIWQYSTQRNCMKRREESAARTEARYEQKMVERRAEARALSTDDELRIIDDYIRGFEQAVKEGRVRYDNPADFNTMVRLKEFKQGRADSRQEVHGLISLEEIQARHKALQARLSAQDQAVAGRVGDRESPRETDETGAEEARDQPDDGDNGATKAGYVAKPEADEARDLTAASFRVPIKAEVGQENEEGV